MSGTEQFWTDFYKVTVGQTALTFDRAILSNIEYQTVIHKPTMEKKRTSTPHANSTTHDLQYGVAGTLDPSGINSTCQRARHIGCSNAGGALTSPR